MSNRQFLYLYDTIMTLFLSWAVVQFFQWQELLNSLRSL